MARATVEVNHPDSYGCGRNGLSKVSAIDLWTGGTLEEPDVYLDIITSKNTVLSGAGFKIPATDMDTLANNWLIARGILETNEEENEDE